MHVLSCSRSHECLELQRHMHGQRGRRFDETAWSMLAEHFDIACSARLLRRFCLSQWQMTQMGLSCCLSEGPQMLEMASHACLELLLVLSCVRDEQRDGRRDDERRRTLNT